MIEIVGIGPFVVGIWSLGIVMGGLGREIAAAIERRPAGRVT